MCYYYPYVMLILVALNIKKSESRSSRKDPHDALK